MLKALRKITRLIYFSGVFNKLTPVAGRKVVIVTGLIVLILYSGFSFFVTHRLRSERKIVTDAYVKLIEDRLLRGDYTGFDSDEFRSLIRKIDMPVIITDTLWEPILWEHITHDRIFGRDKFPESNLTKEHYRDIKNKITRFKRSLAPSPLYNENSSRHIGYLLLGKNRFFTVLSLMPYVEVMIIVAYFVLFYMVFHNVRLTERSNIWVGLAKETAHQLGTPISSLMGWVEYMRTIHEADPPIAPDEFMSQVSKICEDMDNDLKRLRTVTARFSQIGSVPALQDLAVNDVLRDVAEYFRMRLPLLKKRIDIKFNFSEIPPALANKDLMEWVFENILKNSIDAIERNDGLIEITTEYIASGNIIRIEYKDNGKGISRDIQQHIFSPGFTTKKRGWGLGLTLAKRVVEEYHNGRIYISWSQKDKGTSFCIDLPSVSEVNNL